MYRIRLRRTSRCAGWPPCCLRWIPPMISILSAKNAGTVKSRRTPSGLPISRFSAICASGSPVWTTRTGPLRLRCAFAFSNTIYSKGNGKRCALTRAPTIPTFPFRIMYSAMSAASGTRICFTKQFLPFRALEACWRRLALSSKREPFPPEMPQSAR